MRYRMIVDSSVEKKAVAGTEIYLCKRSDYGCARDDERALGKPCRSMSLNPDGDYPFFVVPCDEYEVIEL